MKVTSKIHNESQQWHVWAEQNMNEWKHDSHSFFNRMVHIFD